MKKPRKLKCVVVCLASAVREADLGQVARCPCNQLFCEFDGWDVGVVEANGKMCETFHLPGSDRCQFAATVANLVYPSTALCVQVLAAINVPKPCSLTMRKYDGVLSAAAARMLQNTLIAFNPVSCVDGRRRSHGWAACDQKFEKVLLMIFQAPSRLRRCMWSVKLNAPNPNSFTTAEAALPVTTTNSMS